MIRPIVVTEWFPVLLRVIAVRIPKIPAPGLGERVTVGHTVQPHVLVKIQKSVSPPFNGTTILRIELAVGNNVFADAAEIDVQLPAGAIDPDLDILVARLIPVSLGQGPHNPRPGGDP